MRSIPFVKYCGSEWTSSTLSEVVDDRYFLTMVRPIHSSVFAGRIV